MQFAAHPAGILESSQSSSCQGSSVTSRASSIPDAVVLQNTAAAADQTDAQQPQQQQRQEDSAQICFDFTKGMCTRGDKCKYSHDIATIVDFNSKEKGICFDYLRNQCHRGLLCRFSHDLSNIAQQCQVGLCSLTACWQTCYGWLPCSIWRWLGQCSGTLLHVSCVCCHTTTQQISVVRMLHVCLALRCVDLVDLKCCHKGCSSCILQVTPLTCWFAAVACRCTMAPPLLPPARAAAAQSAMTL